MKKFFDILIWKTLQDLTIKEITIRYMWRLIISIIIMAIPLIYILLNML
jgi:hypothetical protein